MQAQTRPHPFQDADPELIFHPNSPLPPLTPEEQLFKVDGIWLFYDPHIKADHAFQSKEEALAAAAASDSMLQPLQHAEDQFLVLIDQVIALVEEIQAEQEIAA